MDGADGTAWWRGRWCGCDTPKRRHAANVERSCGRFWVLPRHAEPQVNRNPVHDLGKSVTCNDILPGQGLCMRCGSGVFARGGRATYRSPCPTKPNTPMQVKSLGYQLPVLSLLDGTGHRGQ